MRIRRKGNIDMREYGGYIELERNCGLMLHGEAIALNCGRNVLAYLCETKNKKVVSSVFPLLINS